MFVTSDGDLDGDGAHSIRTYNYNGIGYALNMDPWVPDPSELNAF